MKPIPVIVIFDIGKTNKKLFLFNEQYEIVFEKSARFNEIVDEDGFPCENIDALKQSLFESLNEVLSYKRFSVKAINFSCYGASLVYIDKDGKVLTPLYNYLKPYPTDFGRCFYEKYGGEEKFSCETASPVLGSLNAGMQMYRYKHKNPFAFAQTKHALFLTQYLCYLLTSFPGCDVTSVGCHTGMWDFKANTYHRWLNEENLVAKLPPLVPLDHVVTYQRDGEKIKTGIGIHDSSAALIPYLKSFKEPFALLSTGTWCITLNPFNNAPLTTQELKNDCLCYLDYQGIPVKASRLFSGFEHEHQTKRITSHFETSASRYRNVQYDQDIFQSLLHNEKVKDSKGKLSEEFSEDLNNYLNADQAYYHLVFCLAKKQFYSSGLVIQKEKIKRLFVDGGFSNNHIFMNLLASFFVDLEIYAASMAQASALGAALVLHKHWNQMPFPTDIVQLRFYRNSSIIFE